MSSEEEEESEDEEYPPWLAVVLDEHADYWDDVVVLQSASKSFWCILRQAPVHAVHTSSPC